MGTKAIHVKEVYDFLLHRGRKGAKPGETSKHLKIKIKIKGKEETQPLSRTNRAIYLWLTLSETQHILLHSSSFCDTNQMFRYRTQKAMFVIIK
jgi:hypothetical protein